MDQMSDADLVALARAGDRDAFGKLAERYSPMARRVAYRALSHHDAAQEITQEAIVQAYLSLDRLRNPDRFQSWLYRIVLNLCRHHIRDRAANRTLSYKSLVGGTTGAGLLTSDTEPGPQEVAEARELARSVRDAVDMLSPSNRAATLMYYFDQPTVREIALHLGISISAVKGRLHKSRNILRETLEPLTALLEGVSARTKGEMKVMVKVSIADILGIENTDEETGRTTQQFVDVLKEDGGNRAFPIWVGPAEGEAIVMGLKDI